ncbi:MAG TPA: DUF2249 domain-containing protein [Candidatus Sulfotelmatobacter sp.]|nr:DUF2249 domain-containing protein [Candidatus Sulfotelmatobacter sp.]HWI57130.1 DUF2249 domain-containing protein [Bacillota bacterium]
MQSNSLPVSNGQPASAPAPQPLVLDVRPVFARGGSPCSSIDEAVASLQPSQSLVLIAPFEPAPLFAKLGALGFVYCSTPQADGNWRIEFTPSASAPASETGYRSCGCSGA